jgi:hypothetical protein
MVNRVAMYVGSMDHSPSEQLGNLDDWHTTVLLLSEAVQHWTLAEDIAQSLGTRNGLLRKWSSNPSYRQNGKFEFAFSDSLAKHDVYVRVISAQGQTIRHCVPQLIAQLGLSGHVQNFIRNKKPYLKFGPFKRVTFPNNGIETEPVYFDVVERQALPLIFICHFVLRMHQQLMPIIREKHPELEWIDWQLMPNKFPGDIGGPMGSLFHAIMSGAAKQRLVAGDIRVVTLTEPKADLGSSLADNIAGWVAERLVLIGNHSRHLKLEKVGERFDWEIWRECT